MRAIFVLLACCASPPPPPARPPSPPAPVRDAGPRCYAPCEVIILSRHDACGRRSGPPWPTWCGDDNARMLADCKLTCGE